MEIKPGQEKELCHMFLDCCAEQRTYEKFFGLLSQVSRIKHNANSLNFVKFDNFVLIPVVSEKY